MRDWVILCEQSQLEIEKKRFAGLDNVTILPDGVKNRAKVRMHLNEKKPVLSMGILAKEIVETDNPECLYILMASTAFSLQEVLEKVSEKIHLVFTDKESCRAAKEIFGRTAEYIEADLNDYGGKADIAKRKYPVLFVNSYLNPKDGKDVLIDRSADFIWPLMEDVIKHSQKDYTKPLDEVWCEVLSEQDLNFDKEMITELTKKYHEDIVIFIERAVKEKTVKTLIEKEIPVAVIGENWNVFKEKLPEDEKPLLTILQSFINGEGVAKAMQNSKAVLNVNRAIKNGVSFGVQQAANYGCLVVTEKNPGSEQLQKEWKNLVLYSAGQSTACANAVKRVIEKIDTRVVPQEKRESSIVEWMKQQ